MLHRKESLRQRRAGFTLMEMLVVVAIIVALAGIGVVSYFALFEQAKADVAAAQIQSLSSLCDQYRIKNGDFPDSLQALTQPDPNRKVYVEDPNKLLDPWKKPYQYDKNGQKNQGRHADIYTVSPDGLEIGNWPKQQSR
jgi:general secretion pathway protein G